MQPAADEMKIALKDVHFQKPMINVISNVTAKPVSARKQLGKNDNRLVATKMEKLTRSF